METASLVRELTEARGLSGYEAEVRETITKRFSPFAHDVRTDALGNCIALHRGTGGPGPDGKRPSLMLAGHMDEIGLMVTGIEKGFLRVTEIGGFAPRVLPGQEVVVHGRRELSGVVVSVPPHFTDPAAQEKTVPLDKLFVDVGLPVPEVEGLVRVGDLITQRPRWSALAGGYAACKSMDDRLAVAAMALCLEEVSRRSHEWDLYAVATVQEEETMAGARTGAFGIQPTAAVAIDVTFGAQPGLSATETAKLDGGPVIALGPNFHPRMHERLVEAARGIELPYQVEVSPGPSGTDAWGIQVSHSGVPCGLVSIPLRYMHTPIETVCLRDVERTARLLAELVCRLPVSFAGTLATRDALAPQAPAADGKETH
jgi:tetrahedral aminopeptidase